MVEIELKRFVKDKTLGYYYVYLPEHELANKSGKVYMHRYIMAKNLGRMLKSEEHVHHINEDKADNRLSNLEILSSSEHGLKHIMERIPSAGNTEIKCSYCCNVFKRHNSDINVLNNFCNYDCQGNFYRRFEISEQELRDLVWSIPTTKVAKILGVSDVAVGKRCKLYGITKPPRGYWRKVECSKL